MRRIVRATIILGVVAGSIAAWLCLWIAFVGNV